MTHEIYIKVKSIMMEQNVSFKKACSIVGKRGGENNATKIKRKQQISSNYKNEEYYWQKY